jgi:hypothetical protein
MPVEILPAGVRAQLEAEDAVLALDVEPAIIVGDVLEFARSLQGKVQGAHTALFKVPDIDEGRGLGPAYSRRKIQFAFSDIRTLPNGIEAETGDILNKIVFQGILRSENDHRACGKGGKAEFGYAVAVGRGPVFHGIPIAVEHLVLLVNHPLEGIAEIPVYILIYDGLHKAGLREIRGYPFDENSIFLSVYGFFMALADVYDGKRVFPIGLFHSERNNVRVIVLVGGSQIELPYKGESFAFKAVDAGYAPILAAQKISSADIHSLVGERLGTPIFSLKGAHKFHLGPGCQKDRVKKDENRQNDSFHGFFLIWATSMVTNTLSHSKLRIYSLFFKKK